MFNHLPWGSKILRSLRRIVFRLMAPVKRIHPKLYPYAVLAAVVVCAGILSFYGLGNHAFWEDEANTALFGRNLIRFGSLTAWDGTNLIGYRAGAELDRNLKNFYMPPLQYYAAALGIYLFGETNLGGRIIFLLAGLAALVAVALWAKWHFGKMVPWHLAPLAAAFSTAYLLYIRQCRYYALAAFFSAGLLAAFSYKADTGLKGRIALLAGASLAACLVFTNYLNAAALFGSLPLFFLLRRYRTRDHYRLFAVISAVALVSGIFILTRSNPLHAGIPAGDPTPFFTRIFMLGALHLKDLARFEFIPAALLPVLAGPFIFRRLREFRPAAAECLFLMGFMAVYIAILVSFSPQPAHMAAMADMRYLVPLILIGSVLILCTLQILWFLSRPVAVAIAVLLFFSNALYLSALTGQPHRSTLWEYISENRVGYKTGTEAVVEFLRTVRPGSTVRIIPPSMTYPAMFYVPGLHYICQLDPDKDVAAAIRPQLPDYVFCGMAAADILIIGGIQPVNFYYIKSLRSHEYRLLKILDSDWRDCSRPEIPQHCFGPPDVTYEISAFERIRDSRLSGASIRR